VSLSTSPHGPNQTGTYPFLSTTFSSNVGPDNTVVLSVMSGSISGAGCAPPGPCPFANSLVFTNGFLYNPNHGPLLIDIQLPAFYGTGQFDVVDCKAPGCGIADVNGPLASPTANNTDLGSNIIQLTYQTLVTYSAASLTQAGSPYQVANVLGLNNHGQVLVDICSNGNCTGSNRTAGVWSNGVITPLTMPTGCTYIASPSYWGINDSGFIYGGLSCGSLSKAALWKNGVATVLPDAPYSSGFGGGGCPSSENGQSYPSGMNASGHIVGSTTYAQNGSACSAFWVYNGSSFRVVPVPIPAACSGLPRGYYPGVTVDNPLLMNDADQALGTLQNLFCGPPYVSPGWPYTSDPFIVQTNGSGSFLNPGTILDTRASGINDVGDVLGYYGVNGGSAGGLLLWDQNGLHDLGHGGYASLNQVGQVVYLGPNGADSPTSCSESGCLYLWQRGVSIPLILPAGLSGPDEFMYPGPLNDAGQLIVSGAVGGTYLLSPSGACGQDVTSQVQVMRGGFRLNHATGHFTQTLTVTNTSGSTIAGPISVALDNVPSNATLYGISGATFCSAPQGSLYLNLPAASLYPGVPVTATVEFIDTDQTGISYTVRVLAGPGGR
jgi:hypothetical protein